MWPTRHKRVRHALLPIGIFHVTSHGAQVLHVTKDMSPIKALVTLMRSESEPCKDDTAFVFSSRVNE